MVVHISPHISPHITPHVTPHPVIRSGGVHLYHESVHYTYHPPVVLYMPLLHQSVSVPATMEVEKEDSTPVSLWLIVVIVLIAVAMILFLAWLETT